MASVGLPKVCYFSIDFNIFLWQISLRSLLIGTTHCPLSKGCFRHYALKQCGFNMASERSDICRFNMASGHSDMFFSNLRFRLKNQTVVRQSILLCIYFDLRLLCRKIKSEGTSHLVLNARLMESNCQGQRRPPSFIDFRWHDSILA